MASISQAFSSAVGCCSRNLVADGFSSLGQELEGREAASAVKILKTFSLCKTSNSSRFNSSCRSFSGPSSSSSSFQFLNSKSSASVSFRHQLGQDGEKNHIGTAKLCVAKAGGSKSSEISPFTEKYSPKKKRGGGLLVDITRDYRNNSGFNFPAQRNSHPDFDENQSKTLRDQFVCPPVGEASSESDTSNSAQDGENRADSHEISSQLPELREVLVLLREKWNEEAAVGKRKSGPGNVFLVGTGPGDPELLTVKALKLMQSADLVLYDRLVSTDILDLVHPGARLLYVGKTSGFHSRTQEEIHELLLNFAEAGATVVRLKGGDPLVFGRGGEEMDFLQEQGIRVQVVPGITAASGIAAELGIPLTHRGVANSVRYLTGHSRKGGDDPLYVADQAADPDSTLVIYMGLATLPVLAAKLLANGLSPNTPAAAIERGTTAQQRTVFATLSDLSTEVKKVELVSPTLIFIGKVVSLSPMWPFNEVSSSELSSVATIKRVVTEPRDRRKRGPDPALPSQQ